MKRLITILVLMLILIPMVLALSVTRDFSKTSVNKGEQITVTYTPSSTNIKFWAINDPIPNGWSASVEGIMGGNAYGCSTSGGALQCFSASSILGGAATSIRSTWTAPNYAVSSIFTGDYAIETENDDFSSQIVIVGGGTPCVPSYSDTCDETDGCSGTRDTDGTSCGTNKMCQNGFCVESGTCESHYEKKCYQDDVYWYDSCDNREERKESCDSDEECDDGECVCKSKDEKRCYKGDVWWYDSCGDKEKKYKECDDDEVCVDDECMDDVECASTCSYISTCAEYGEDKCDGTCTRNTEGISCGTEMVCEEGSCVKTEEKQVTTTATVKKEKTITPVITSPITGAVTKEVEESDNTILPFLLVGIVILIIIIFLVLWKIIRMF